MSTIYVSANDIETEGLYINFDGTNFIVAPQWLPGRTPSLSPRISRNASETQLLYFL